MNCHPCKYAVAPSHNWSLPSEKLGRCGLPASIYKKLSLFQITNLMHNSFIFQQYVCYTTLLSMFRAARCSSSGGPIISPQSPVSSPSVSSRTVCRWRPVPIRPWNSTVHNRHWTSIQDLVHPNSWQTPVAAVTVYNPPHDGRIGRPKYVEHTCSC